MRSYKLMLWRLFNVAFFIAMIQGCSSGTSDDDKPLVKKQPTVHSVEIAQMKFNPSELSVKKGDIILFINHDLVPHDITEQPGKSWHSSPIAPGQTWKLEVREATDYFCSIHPVMKGKIMVTKNSLD